jgi:hypothetical protein
MNYDLGMALSISNQHDTDLKVIERLRAEAEQLQRDQ